MDRKDIAFVLLTGFSILLAIQILDHLNINDPFVTFAVLALIYFVITNNWKHVKL